MAILSMCKQGYNPYYTHRDICYVFLFPRHVLCTLCTRHVFGALFVPQNAVENEWLSEKEKLNRKIIIIGGGYKEDVCKGVRIVITILWSRKRGDSQKIHFWKQTQQFETNTYHRQKANLAIYKLWSTEKMEKDVKKFAWLVVLGTAHVY